MQKTFKKGAFDNELIYPLESVEDLKPCRLVNPKVGKGHGLKIPNDFNLLASTQEIQRVGHEVEKGIFPRWFFEKYYPFKYMCPTDIPEPLKMEGLSYDDPKGLANVVHMDSLRMLQEHLQGGY